MKVRRNSGRKHACRLYRCCFHEPFARFKFSIGGEPRGFVSRRACVTRPVATTGRTPNYQSTKEFPAINDFCDRLRTFFRPPTADTGLWKGGPISTNRSRESSRQVPSTMTARNDFDESMLQVVGGVFDLCETYPNCGRRLRRRCRWEMDAKLASVRPPTKCARIGLGEASHRYLSDRPPTWFLLGPDY